MTRKPAAYSYSQHKAPINSCDLTIHMQVNINIIEAMLHCKYKAWQLAKEKTIDANEFQVNNQGILLKPTKQYQQAERLLADAKALLNDDMPPPFYKIFH